MNHLRHTILFLMLISLFSCSKEDESLNNPSRSQLNFEGEGGQESIALPSGEWKITKVINQNNHQNIFGNIYSPSGNLLQKNNLLLLNGLGSLEAVWSNKGFVIERETETAMTIHLDENFTEENFGFMIYLESGNASKQISINQKPFEGYELKNIKYSIDNSAVDSVFIQKGKTYTFNINSTVQQTLSLDPFHDAFEFSQFESNVKGAFPWAQRDSIMVETPSQRINGELFTTNRQLPYSNELTKIDSKFKGQSTEINLPQGQSEFVVELEYRKRKVSYTLTLINNRTSAIKTITGKWIETAPTGNYEIKWQ